LNVRWKEWRSKQERKLEINILKLKDPDKIYEDIEDYIKEHTSILQLIDSSKLILMIFLIIFYLL